MTICLVFWEKLLEIIPLLGIGAVPAVDISPTSHVQKSQQFFFLLCDRCAAPRTLLLTSLLNYLAQNGWKFAIQLIGFSRFWKEYQIFLFVWTSRCLVVISRIYLIPIALLDRSLFFSNFFIFFCCCLSVLDVRLLCICLPCLSVKKILLQL